MNQTEAESVKYCLKYMRRINRNVKKLRRDLSEVGCPYNDGWDGALYAITSMIEGIITGIRKDDDTERS